MPGGLSFPELGAVMAAATLAATLQGSIGFGFSLIVVPTLTLINAEALPGTILLVAIPMTVFLTHRERSSIDKRGFALTTVGRIGGTALGAALLALVATDDLAILMGSIVLLAVGLSAFARDVETGSRGQLVAGVASGAMGTAAALGGPPLAIAWQSRPGPVLRSTLSASFVVGSLMSLAGLLLVGKLRVWHAVLALELLPAVSLGLSLSKRTIRLADTRWLRPAILVFAAAAGTVTILLAVAR